MYSRKKMYSKTLRFKSYYYDNTERPFRENKEKSKLLMKEFFWTAVKAQITQSKIRNDRRTRFPGAEAVVKNCAVDLWDSNQISRTMGRALKVPINTIMVYRSEIPHVGFDDNIMHRLYMQQKRLRRTINNEIMEFLIINSHNGWEHEELTYEHDFWKFSDDVVAAINDMSYFLIAANYNFDFTI